MGMAVTIHAVGEADLAQQVDRPLLQSTGPNSLQDIMPGLPLQHDAIDAVPIEDVRQQQTGRAPADDCYLGSHGVPNSAAMVHRPSIIIAPSSPISASAP